MLTLIDTHSMMAGSVPPLSNDPEHILTTRLSGSVPALVFPESYRTNSGRIGAVLALVQAGAAILDYYRSKKIYDNLHKSTKKIQHWRNRPEVGYNSYRPKGNTLQYERNRPEPWHSEYGPQDVSSIQNWRNRPSPFEAMRDAVAYDLSHDEYPLQDVSSIQEWRNRPQPGYSHYYPKGNSLQYERNRPPVGFSDVPLQDVRPIQEWRNRPGPEMAMRNAVQYQLELEDRLTQDFSTMQRWRNRPSPKEALRNAVLYELGLDGDYNVLADMQEMPTSDMPLGRGNSLNSAEEKLAGFARDTQRFEKDVHYDMADETISSSLDRLKQMTTQPETNFDLMNRLEADWNDFMDQSIMDSMRVGAEIETVSPISQEAGMGKKEKLGETLPGRQGYSPMTETQQLEDAARRSRPRGSVPEYEMGGATTGDRLREDRPSSVENRYDPSGYRRKARITKSYTNGFKEYDDGWSGFGTRGEWEGKGAYLSNVELSELAEQYDGYYGDIVYDPRGPMYGMRKVRRYNKPKPKKMSFKEAWGKVKSWFGSDDNDRGSGGQQQPGRSHDDWDDGSSMREGPHW